MTDRRHPDIRIAVDPELVADVGAAGAILWTQIAFGQAHTRYSAGSHKPGWFTARAEELSALTGLSVDQVRRASRRLDEAGWLRRQKFRAQWQADHTLSYKAVRPGGPEDPDPVEPPDPASGDAASPRFGGTAGSSSSQEMKRTEDPPHTPPQAVGNQVGLFDTESPAAGIATAAERRRASRTASERGIEAAFDAWWEAYPGDQRRGSKKAARRAWQRALRQEHLTVTMLTERRDRYSQCRIRFAEHWGVPIETVPLMHASTFLGGKHDDDAWSSPILPSHVPTLWPQPRGARAQRPGDAARLAALQKDRAARAAAEEAKERDRRSPERIEQAIAAVMRQGFSRAEAEAMVREDVPA